jgi:hypothetical protein
LSEANVGQQGIAQTLATKRVLWTTAFAGIRTLGFGGAAVANPTLFAPEWNPQRTDVTHEWPVLKDLVIGEGVRAFQDLERKAGGRGAWIGQYAQLTLSEVTEDLSLELWLEARFFAEGKHGADLHAGGARCDGSL